MIDTLTGILDVQLIGDDVFAGEHRPGTHLPVFGGQLVAQALAAAARTTGPEQAVHSLHGYFLRAGDSSAPLTYVVDRLRDGRAFAVRRVDARQGDRGVFTLTASFQLPGPGLDHGSAAPDVPAPESLPTLEERLAGYEHEIPWAGLPQPVELRYVDDPPWLRKVLGAPLSRVWLRAATPLPDEPITHACALAFASDMTPLESVLVAHGTSWGRDGLLGLSLDHALWFHRPFRADDWLLYESVSPSSSGGRGLATGRVWSQAGHHVATVAQEGLIRLRQEMKL